MALIHPTLTSIIADGSYILDLLTAGGGQDTVAFFDQGNPGNQIFVNARPVKVLLRESIRAMQHPVETGQLVSDYKIVNPKELDVSVIISARYYIATYNELKQYFNSSSLIGFAMRVGYALNFIITDMPHQETPEQFDVITMNLHLKEVLFVPAPAPYAPASPATASTPAGGGIPGITDNLPDATAADIQDITKIGQQNPTDGVPTASLTAQINNVLAAE